MNSFRIAILSLIAGLFMATGCDSTPKSTGSSVADLVVYNEPTAISSPGTPTSRSIWTSPASETAMVRPPGSSGTATAR